MGQLNSWLDTAGGRIDDLENRPELSKEYHRETNKQKERYDK
jgi:hypothetical protein